MLSQDELVISMNKPTPKDDDQIVKTNKGMVTIAENNCGDVIKKAKVMTIVGCRNTGVIEFVRGEQEIFFSN